MARFEATGPSIRYTPTEQPKGFQQLAGLYNMWQALPPSTRNSIIETMFGPAMDGEIVSIDSSLMPPSSPEGDLFETNWAKTGTTNALVGLPSLPTESTDITEWWTGTFGDRPSERISRDIRSSHTQYSNTRDRLKNTVYKLPSVGRR